MKEIFEQGEFSEYRINNLQKSRGVINESFSFFEEKVPVFISHKHDDLDDLKGIIGFLEKNFNVIAYIDSRDLSMPKITSGETAEKIGSIINVVVHRSAMPPQHLFFAEKSMADSGRIVVAKKHSEGESPCLT